MAAQLQRRVREAAQRTHLQAHVFGGRVGLTGSVPNEAERESYVPNVVYTCGALRHERELIIPYAMSDSATSFATVPLDHLLTAME